MNVLDINEENKHPYMDVMAQYHWSNGLPFVYRNRENKLVQQWPDGRIDCIEDYVNDDEGFDKRYQEPFEDDGAYAD